MAEQTREYAPGTHPDLPAPPGTRGAVHWMRENLFSSPTNIVLTLLSAFLLYLIVPPLIYWAVINSVFEAGSRIECWEKMGGEGKGACWAIIVTRFDQFVFGFYPVEERWRVLLAGVLLAFALGPVLFDNLPYRKYGLIYTCIYPIIGYFLLWAGSGWSRWNPLGSGASC